MAAERLDFNRAVEWLGGAQAVDLDVAAERAREREAKRRADEAKAVRYRERERERLWKWWRGSLPWPGTPVEDYLRLRLGSLAPYFPPGPCLPLCVRCLPDAPLFADGREVEPVLLHRGPAMIAAIVGADGKFAGLHLTWIDLNEPKGKLAMSDPATGETVPAKKVRGSKSAGHIDLTRCQAPRRLILGEGIEKVAAVQLAMARAGRDLRATAFWTAIDLGNLGGKALNSVPHPTRKNAGRAQRVPGPQPDLAAPAIMIPESVDELVLLGDSTSDRFLTECALARATERYARPGRIVRTVWPPAGVDFDDVLIRGAA